MSLDQILNHYKNDVDYFSKTGELTDRLYKTLFELWVHDMPYGTAKARDGDPYEWICDKLFLNL